MWPGRNVPIVIFLAELCMSNFMNVVTRVFKQMQATNSLVTKYMCVVHYKILFYSKYLHKNQRKKHILLFLKILLCYKIKRGLFLTIK